jgi:Fe-S-cluster-containing hydrogenase component 2
MSKKVLIDLYKLRNLDECKTEAIYKTDPADKSFKTIRELATFQFTCRRCDNAPCINACPADALEKDKDGIISRAVNLCIRCKSCIAICPFGTMMNDLFEVKTSEYRYMNLSDESELEKFAAAYPDDVASIVDIDEDPKQNIYKLNDKILVKEYIWE